MFLIMTFIRYLDHQKQSTLYVSKLQVTAKVEDVIFYAFFIV